MFPALLSSWGCAPENVFQEIPLDAIAVSTGDFDRVEEVLLRLLVNHQLYEGYISDPSYDPDIDADAISLKVETLLGDPDELAVYGAVFLNSGTRGLGAYVYNDVVTDDSLVSDEAVLENVRSFVQAGGVLVLSDWAYDLLEACWPDELDFVGDDLLLDDAQRGSRGVVTSNVLDFDLQNALGEVSLAIQYDYSYWAVIESASDGVDVYLAGDILWRESESQGETELQDVPLLVGFNAGLGRVFFSTFHWRAQSTQVAETILSSVVSGLEPIDQAEMADTGGEG